MSNGAHCRFTNTLADLLECEEALANFDDLSEAEQKAAVRLYVTCVRIVTDNKIATRPNAFNGLEPN